MIVYTCLVGDLFHAGHAEHLRQAAALGSKLLVGVCSDEDCERFKRKPILTLPERAAVIAACRYVDDVIISPPSVVTAEFLDEHHIDLLVHGDDSNEDQLRYFYGESIRRGQFQTVAYTPGITTTGIIQRIRDRPASELDRRNFLSHPP